MLESIKNALDKGLCTGILLTDLSKAFDCISHDLLLAKLHVYGFSKQSLNLVSNNLCDRIQRTKIGEKYSMAQCNLWCSPGLYFGTLIV